MFRPDAPVFTRAHRAARAALTAIARACIIQRSAVPPHCEGDVDDGGRDCTGIVLAGGRGRRMGMPKADLQFLGSPLIGRVIDSIRGACDHLLVVTAPDQYPRLPTVEPSEVVPDVSGSLGPLMGIYTGLRHATSPCSIAVGCDMPFLHAGLLRHLSSLAGGYDAVVPVHDGRPQPLHAVYAAACLPAVEAMIEEGELAVHRLFDRVNTRYVERDEWARFDPDGRTFLGVNTPGELAQAEATARRAHRSPHPAAAR
jgi:molybdopterin-guanine dinucleotide biosynthesis protein A